MAACSQPKPVNRGAEAEAWYKEFQGGEGQEAACVLSDPPAIAGDFQVKSTRLEPMNEADIFRYENILSDGTTDIYVYGWKTEDFIMEERALYAMLGHEPPSREENSELERCFVFSPDALSAISEE